MWTAILCAKFYNFAHETWKKNLSLHHLLSNNLDKKVTCLENLYVLIKIQ